MKARARLSRRVAPVMLFPAAAGFLCAGGHYWTGLACLFLACLFARRLFAFQSRAIKDVRRFIDAIRFSEFNVSFRGCDGKGVVDELAPDMEEALERFSARLRKMEADRNFHDALLNRVDAGIIVVERSGTIPWINKSALDVFGKPCPRHLDDLKSVSPELPPALADLLPGETRIIRLERDARPCQLAVTAMLFMVEGRELKLISMKNVQEILEENESDAWKRLTRVLTHEIMNSLAPVISLSETFASRDDENREMMHDAMMAIHRRSKGLVDFVHNYKRLTSVPLPLPTTFPVAPWLEEIGRLLDASGHAFSSAVRPAGMLLEADRALMSQVLINLIKNARESIPPSRQPRVEVEVSLDEYRRPVITVSDNGEGILPDVLDKIFVPFFTTKPNGSGIGLTICRQIISLHGGRLSVHSAPDKGARFTIKL
ncbi:MAG: ATP-binding protein [Odoribacteraceae bacterium]|jgi:nitrogen fixation/metabolism regulation signal transduction histidine kinase|nr:ATP-binding protein [Odoribacteraceae bacterium]